MWKVIATIAERPTNDYPFAVRAIGPDGRLSQEILCRSTRDAWLVGNGFLSAFSAAGLQNSINVEFDERLKWK